MLIAKMLILLARPRANLYNKITMNKYLRLLLFILVFVVAMKMDAAAENPSGEDGVFDDIKAQMVSSSEENKRLAIENKMLKTQLISLQLEVEQYEQEIGRVDPEYLKARELSEKKKRSANRNDPKGDDLVREAQNIYLSGQSMDLDDVQRLKELKLYDLQYQKQELELDVKSIEFLNQKVSEQRRPETDSLEGEIKENKAKIRNTSIRIAEEEKAALTYPREIELLKMENKALKKRISQLKRLLK